MAIDFPASPTNGQTHTVGSTTWTWDGTKWEITSTGGGATDNITEGNTTAEVVDTGSDGHFKVTTEGTERLRVDANGRLCIGTTPYAWEASSNSQALQVRAGVLLDYISAQFDVGRNLYYDGSGFKYGIASTAEKISFSNGSIWFSTAPSGSANAALTMTERMRITSNGVLKVSPSGSYWSASSTSHEILNANNSANLRVRSANGSFSNTVLDINVDRVTTNNSYAFIRCQPTDLTTRFLVWDSGNVQNTNNSYGAISDIKLKENIVDANSQWDDIKALRPVNYNFKEGQTHTQIGLIAQEVELVSPGLVSESSDRDAEGNDLGTVTKSVNYSVLYMKAVKALQEAMTRIETLETTNASQAATIAAIEARLTALEGGN